MSSQASQSPRSASSSSKSATPLPPSARPRDNGASDCDGQHHGVGPAAYADTGSRSLARDAHVSNDTTDNARSNGDALAPPNVRPGVFSMRIVSIDYYLERPPNPAMDRTFDQFAAQGSSGRLPQVPVIRIFGATFNGQKACLHVHQLGASLNHAVAAAYGRRGNDQKAKFIASILLVKGIPFYGFHANYEYFLKIYIIDPASLRKIVDLLDSGAVMGEPFQVFESHIPYLLQFFMDYNLYGMDFIHLADVRFRFPIISTRQRIQPDNRPSSVSPEVSAPQRPASTSFASSAGSRGMRGSGNMPDTLGQPHYFTEENCSHLRWPSSMNIERMSYCELELDTWTIDIVNRDFVQERPRLPLVNLKGKMRQSSPTTNLFLDASQKLVASLRNVWEDEKVRRRELGLESLGPPRISLPGRRTRSLWTTEERFMTILNTKLKALQNEPSDKFAERVSEYIRAYSEDDHVMTAFTSVGGLHPLPVTTDAGQDHDESRISLSPTPAVKYLSQAAAHFSISSPMKEKVTMVVDESVIEEYLSQQRKTSSQVPRIDFVKKEDELRTEDDVLAGIAGDLADSEVGQDDQETLNVLEWLAQGGSSSDNDQDDAHSLLDVESERDADDERHEVDDDLAKFFEEMSKSQFDRVFGEDLTSSASGGHGRISSRLSSQFSTPVGDRKFSGRINRSASVVNRMTDSSSSSEMELDNLIESMNCSNESIRLDDMLDDEAKMEIGEQLEDSTPEKRTSSPKNVMKSIPQFDGGNSPSPPPASPPRKRPRFATVRRPQKVPIVLVPRRESSQASSPAVSPIHGLDATNARAPHVGKTSHNTALHTKTTTGTSSMNVTDDIISSDAEDMPAHVGLGKRQRQEKASYRTRSVALSQQTTQSHLEPVKALEPAPRRNWQRKSSRTASDIERRSREGNLADVIPPTAPRAERKTRAHSSKKSSYIPSSAPSHENGREEGTSGSVLVATQESSSSIPESSLMSSSPAGSPTLPFSSSQNNSSASNLDRGMNRNKQHNVVYSPSPAFVQVDTKYFTSSIQTMWSDESEDEKRLVIFSQVPLPASPTKAISTQPPANTARISRDLHSGHLAPSLSITRVPKTRGLKSVKFLSDESIGISSATSTSLATENAGVDAATNLTNPWPANLYSMPHPPSTFKTVRDELDPPVIYREPFYSKPSDVPRKPLTFAGREFKFKVQDTANLPLLSNHSLHRPLHDCKYEQDSLWMFASPPPSYHEVFEWTKRNPVANGETKSSTEKRRKILSKVSQIEGPTQTNFGFMFSQINSSSLHFQKEWVTILSMECHASNRGNRLPDPAADPVHAIFCCIQSDDTDEFPTNGRREGYHIHILMVDVGAPISKTGILGYDVTAVPDERELFNMFVYKVREWDPDIIVGYEIHNSSWGYLVERAASAFDINLLSEISRTKNNIKSKFGQEQDPWGSNNTSSLSVTGRIVLNVWRLMRSELALTSYTRENLVFHVLHYRFPKFSPETLTGWYSSTTMVHKWRTIKYYVECVQINLELLDDTEFISRTSEFARVVGVDFFSVVSRGSQFKVESLMCRLAKPENFIMISPTKKQVVGMRAAECLPLVMEPQSRFYSSPLLVLDFQSLYPSVMVAYNYCYSTCLGRVVHAGSSHQFGVTSLSVPAAIVKHFKDDIYVSPNGVAFLKAHVRKGVLGRMLTELLETRVMVKNSIKKYKGDTSLLRILEARQLSLKYVANVTYGYTSASFSGRMPCVDIADSIVQTGREILEKAIDTIQSTKQWGAQVVYGDTDSLFVYLPGATRESAFRIGKEIVEKISSMNPHPVTLKFEKVYHPCVLLAKKRYVGFKYETLDDKEPVFDAKGIETVRRDGCPVVAKTLEKCLRMLFTNQDLSEVKGYLYRQWHKILLGRVSIQDFIIAKEVKLGSYSDHGHPPPGALVAQKKMRQDPRAQPQYAERVPYVVVHGGPRNRLIDSVVSPEELITQDDLQLHGLYYIKKQIIPPLERVFNLFGADVMKWFVEMPKVSRALRFSVEALKKMKTIERYYGSLHCLCCGEVSPQELCINCRRDPQRTAFLLQCEACRLETKYEGWRKICDHCGGGDACISIDCPVYYSRVKSRRELVVGAERLSMVVGKLETAFIKHTRELF